MTTANPDDGLASAWPARLHVVTGKGGVGKSTVAASLALALAAGGRRTLLVEVEGRQGIAQFFTEGEPGKLSTEGESGKLGERDPRPLEERLVATTPSGGEVRALAVDPEEALLEYLALFYRLGVAGRALRKVGAIDFATTIAPGLRDVLLTGKVKEATTRTDEHGRRRYHAVVLDAPPTGRIGRFLNVSAEAAKLAKMGPIKTQSEGVAALLRSPMTSVHLVTLLEEMPVQETLDAAAELRGLGIPVGKVIVNCAHPALLAGVRKVTQAELKRGLAVAGLPVDRPTVLGLQEQAQAYLARQEVETELRAELDEIARPVVELPLLPGGIDFAGLRQLAAVLGTA